MTENGRKLFELISENEEAREEFLNCNDSTQIIKFAADKGLTVTLDDLDFNTVENEGVRPLDLNEMADVAGGKECACFVGGGGAASREGQYTCFCVTAGWGDVGDHKRCFCAVGGGGRDIVIDEATVK